jgi:COP9 signalosome complex subunit 7
VSVKLTPLLAYGAQAISHPNLYHFGELLDHENIAELGKNSETAPWLQPVCCSLTTSLTCAAYGTYAEYRASSSLPPIDEAQALKLKQLTVVSLAAENKVSTKHQTTCAQAGRCR